jgi:hypothetical protein
MKKLKATKEHKEHRAANGRTAELRALHLRNIQSMDYQSVLYIDPDIVPEGMEYRWATISVLGEPRPGRMIGLRRVGWEPVPAERHPELCFTDASKGSIASSGHIERTGLMLIERPREYGELEERLRAEKDYNNLVNMPGMENFMGEPGIPGHNAGNIYLTKNASFGK